MSFLGQVHGKADPSRAKRTDTGRGPVQGQISREGQAGRRSRAQPEEVSPLPRCHEIAEARDPRLSRERLDATRRRGRVETEEALAQPLRGPGHFGIRART